MSIRIALKKVILGFFLPTRPPKIAPAPSITELGDFKKIKLFSF